MRKELTNMQSNRDLPPFLKKYIRRPLHITGRIGLIFALLSVICSLSFFINGFKISNLEILLVSILLGFISYLFICLGLMAEVLIRIYKESKNIFNYQIKEIIND